jgi:hypothetical protein
MSHAKQLHNAEAQTISCTDERIRGLSVEYPSPGGTSGTKRGYLIRPTSKGPFPAVLVIHENRGLNPYVEDVARRAAVETGMGAHHRLLQRRRKPLKKVLLSTTFVTPITGNW